jgi:hypothetical protein
MADNELPEETLRGSYNIEEPAAAHYHEKETFKSDSCGAFSIVDRIFRGWNLRGDQL